MFIIAGLGNPERKYNGTRHNIGFSAVTTISDEYNIPLNTREHKAVCGKGYIEGQKVILALPQTYMNLSGLISLGLGGMRRRDIWISGMSTRNGCRAL